MERPFGRRPKDVALIHLLDEAEMEHFYVTAALLRKLASADPRRAELARGLTRLMRDALKRGVLLSDARQRLTSSGALKPITVYRLNRHNPLVRRLLPAEFD